MFPMIFVEYNWSERVLVFKWMEDFKISCNILSDSAKYITSESFNYSIVYDCTVNPNRWLHEFFIVQHHHSLKKELIQVSSFRMLLLYAAQRVWIGYVSAITCFLLGYKWRFCDFHASSGFLIYFCGAFHHTREFRLDIFCWSMHKRRLILMISIANQTHSYIIDIFLQWIHYQANLCNAKLVLFLISTMPLKWKNGYI